MKPILLFLFFSLCIFQLSAQTVNQPSSQSNFKKNSWQIGLRDGYRLGNIIGYRNTLQVHASYYLDNQLAVGLSGNWGREKFDTFIFNDITVGPFLRYQFTDTRLSPFIDFSYQIGSLISGNGNSSGLNRQSIQISPGVSMRITRFLRAELNYNFQWLGSFSYRAEFMGQPQFGLTYLFSRK